MFINIIKASNFGAEQNIKTKKKGFGEVSQEVTKSTFARGVNKHQSVKLSNLALPESNRHRKRASLEVPVSNFAAQFNTPRVQQSPRKTIKPTLKSMSSPFKDTPLKLDKRFFTGDSQNYFAEEEMSPTRLKFRGKRRKTKALNILTEKKRVSCYRPKIDSLSYI